MNKEEFKARANQAIDEASAKIHELQAKKENAEGEARGKYESAIKDIETHKATLETKLHDLKNAGEHKWEEAKVAFSSASDSFKEGLGKIKTLFS